jgi:hypothetical protein
MLISVLFEHFVILMTEKVSRLGMFFFVVATSFDLHSFVHCFL